MDFEASTSTENLQSEIQNSDDARDISIKGTFITSKEIAMPENAYRTSHNKHYITKITFSKKGVHY
jgi:hypothetical protein